MTAKMNGKVALVTGAGSGIGRATALAFSSEGARVIVADVSMEGGEETVRLIADSGGDAKFVRADVGVGSEVDALVEATLSQFGRLDYAHNNAGAEQPRAGLADIDDADFDRIVLVNIKGTFLCMKHEIPAMLAGGGGTIVNTASVSGLVGVTQNAAYSASKHAIIGLTKTCALDYATMNIRVNAVCPGVTRTALLERRIAADPTIEANFTASHPMARLATPDEVAAAVVWLCSDQSSFVTGHALAVDGGWLAQ